MEQFIQFAGQHLWLITAWLFVFGLLIWTFIGDALQGVQHLSPQQAALLMNHENAIVVDVREESEYIQGHILEALNIPISNLSDKIQRLTPYQLRPVIITCLSGNRSVQAYHRLKKAGFTRLHNLKGGIIAWQNANLPLNKGKK